MNTLPHIPLQVEPSALSLFTAPDQRADDYNDNAPWKQQVRVYQNVAVLPIWGVLIDSAWSGRHLLAVQQQLQSVLLDPAVNTLILDIDSPGGACMRDLETIDLIEQLRLSGRAVIAYSSGWCCSLAYRIACACDLIITSPSAYVGSISTFISMQDTSARYEEMGIKVHSFATGQYKGAGAPGVPVTEPQLQHMREQAVVSDQQFKAYVSQRRGVSADAMQGQCWQAQFAPEGLVDQFIPSLDQLIASVMEG